MIEENILYHYLYALIVKVLRMIRDRVIEDLPKTLSIFVFPLMYMVNDSSIVLENILFREGYV